MINMCNIIAGLQFPQCAQGNGLAFIIGLFDLVLVITLKDLMIRIAYNPEVLINKSFMNGSGNRFELNTGFQILKNGMQPLELPGILREQIQRVFLAFPGFQVLYQQVELTIECRLRTGVELDDKRSPPIRFPRGPGLPIPAPGPGLRTCLPRLRGFRVSVGDRHVQAVAAVALDAQPLSSCASADRDSDGTVRIDELIAAINTALAA